MPPRYKHTCPNCTYLGQSEEYDLYVCSRKNREIDSIIARFGNEGPDYISGLHYALSAQDFTLHTIDKARWTLAQALLRAIAKGYTVKKEDIFEKENKAIAVRVLTYEGTPEFVTTSLEESSIPLNGSKTLPNGCSINSTIVQVFTKCLFCSTLTINKTLICDLCTKHAESFVEDI